MCRQTRSVTLAVLSASVLVLALAPPTVNADTIYVCWDGSGDYETIQEGIDAASDGDEVVVCDGTYTGPGNKNLDFDGKAITVSSANGPDNCIIDCEGDGRGFYFHSGEANTSVVDGFTITNGAAEYYGGGLDCYSSSPTVHQCRFTANTAGLNGGGLCARGDSNPIISNCTFTGNAAPYGGGIAILVSARGHATVTDCVIVNNTATDRGGGIVSGGGTISGCVITGNTAGDRGGGMYIAGDLTIMSCTISGNAAGGAWGYGGGIACYWADAAIIDCTMAENTATAGGGAVECSDSRLSIVECTITENAAGIDGGGLFCGGSQTSCAIAASLIAENVAHTDGGAIYCTDTSSLGLVNATIAGNDAGKRGGAINCSHTDQVMLSNCAITGNAGETGGALFFGSSPKSAPSSGS